MWSCTVCHHHHTVTIVSDIVNYTNEIRIAKYSMRGDVCGHVLPPPLSIRGRDANVSFKGTLGIHVLNYVTWLVILGIHALNYVSSLVLLRLA